MKFRIDFDEAQNGQVIPEMLFIYITRVASLAISRRRRKCQDKSEYMKIGSILERAIFQSSRSPIQATFPVWLACLRLGNKAVYLKMYEG